MPQRELQKGHQVTIGYYAQDMPDRLDPSLTIKETAEAVAVTGEHKSTTDFRKVLDQAAKKALVEWLETTPAERAEMLLKLADALDEHAEEIAERAREDEGRR